MGAVLSDIYVFFVQLSTMALSTRVVNVVVTASTNCFIDLHTFSRQVWNVKYNPRKFSGASWRLRAASSTCVLFSTGAIVCAGARSIFCAKRDIRVYARRLQIYGCPVRLSPVSIQTITGTLCTDRSTSIDLDNFVSVCRTAPEAGGAADYSPELFPSAMLSVNKCHVSVFCTGRVVITGARTIQQLEEAGVCTISLINRAIDRDSP